jgi:hypothetical protein
MKTILDNILELINTEILDEQIDRTLDMAMENFVYQQPAIITHKNFNTLITKFYQHINKYGLNNKKNLSDSEVFKEISWLLEARYPSKDHKGYENAFYDAVNEGYKFIFKRLITIIKTIEKDKYVNWAIKTHIDPTDWNQRKKIAEEIFERYGKYLPHKLKRFSPTQLTSHLEELIKTIS